MKLRITETGEIRDITLDSRLFYVEESIDDNATGPFPATRETVRVRDTADTTEDVILYYGGVKRGKDACYETNQAVADFWASYARTNADDLDRLQALYDRHHEDSRLWAAMSRTMARYLDNDASRDALLEHANFMAMFAELHA